MNKDRNLVKVVTVNPTHICVGAVIQPRSTANRQAWLQCILPATLTIARKPHYLRLQVPLSFTIRFRLLMTQQNVRRSTSWVMTWKVKQCDSVCCLHLWVLSILQTRKHMYIFLLRTVREHAAFSDCLSTLASVAKHFAIADHSLLWTEPLRRKSLTLPSCLLRPLTPTTTLSCLLGQLQRARMKALGDSFCPTFAQQFHKPIASASLIEKKNSFQYCQAFQARWYFGPSLAFCPVGILAHASKSAGIVALFSFQNI